MLNSNDIALLKQKGISEENVLAQIDRFKTGFAQLNVLRAATPGDGIKIMSLREQEHYSAIYQNDLSASVSITKFVPASGAATRMFKDLYQYLGNPLPVDELPSSHPVHLFITSLHKFAFFPILQKAMSDCNIADPSVRIQKAADIIATVLNSKLLNYGNLPKGLVHFHTYTGSIIRTAMEEHLVEACHYAAGSNGLAQIHFTVSPEHEQLFKNKLSEQKSQIENQYGVKLDINFSFQKPHTDTIAVTPDNQPFRDSAGQLVFRPGGHGALIENLNELNADIIFVKNIDNVVPEHLSAETVTCKKALAGLLRYLQRAVFNMLVKLDSGHIENLDETEQFINSQLFASLPESYTELTHQQKTDYLRGYLNRPMRVCGMVRNEGEPGGGPFWVMDSNGQETLQILESSQLDMSNPQQAGLLQKSTHFNPVDLVCAVKDYKGTKFDLTAFADPETGFISGKSVSGQPIKALELPGLWNGAMANWITLFVEVPVATFNPVKTVNDLLRPQHQPC